MKVVLKGGNTRKNREIEKFFIEEIFPILKSEIAIESSNSIIIVHKRGEGRTIKKHIDPTAEVVVELTEEAIDLAKNGKVTDDELKRVFGKFFDEAQAIKKIEELRPPFSVEYYSCRYTPKT